MADLYVYFYELGIRLLRPGGRLSFVVTNKWMKAAYAEPLRRFFTENTWMESVVDFGHAKQMFTDADVFPGIIVVRKPSDAPRPATARVCAIPREQLRIDDLSQQVRAEGFEVQAENFSAGSWTLESPAVSDLLEKIREKGKPLYELAGVEPLYGIKTGCNEAFLIDTPLREELVRDDPESAEIIRPYLRGQDIGRWSARWDGLWMIALKSSGDHSWSWSRGNKSAEQSFRRSYPGVYAHMKRGTGGNSEHVHTGQSSTNQNYVSREYHTILESHLTKAERASTIPPLFYLPKTCGYYAASIHQ
jgi:hypothetical protein